MKEELITKAYEVAKERYAALGVDVEKVMEQLQKVAISMHCWQDIWRKAVRRLILPMCAPLTRK